MTFNLCDKLHVNITSDQILKLYAAAQGQYASLQEFLLAEWSKIFERLASHEPPSDENSKSKTSEHKWEDYVDKTKSTVRNFWMVMNETLRDVSKNVAPQLKMRADKLHNKLNKKMKHLSSYLGNGLDSIKKKVFGKHQDPSERHSKKVDSGGSQADAADHHGSDEQTEEPFSFEKRLETLKEKLRNLDSWRVEKMKRYLSKFNLTFISRFYK